MLTLFSFGNRSKRLINILAQQKPAATAEIRGNRDHPKLYGIVAFYAADKGVIVVAELRGIPAGTNSCNSPVLGFHIHEQGRCSGSPSPFSDTGVTITLRIVRIPITQATYHRFLAITVLPGWLSIPNVLQLMGLSEEL